MANRNEIINLIKSNLIEIIPELAGEEILADEPFVNLGANSVDRAELINLTLEKLNLEISRIEFVGAQSVNDLAELVYEKLE